MRSLSDCPSCPILVPNGAGDFHGLVGRSPAMQRVYRLIERFGPAPLPIVLLGETGTGKEMAARAIRQLHGARKPFVAVNCAALPEGLVESELFGHVRGAFTGAVASHSGILAEARGGILFLDEVAELPLSSQAKLLDVLETGEFRPVGANRVTRSQFRLVVATNRDLGHLTRRGLFREDLFHRLGAVRIVLPPLRERFEDLPRLAEAFVSRVRQETGGGPRRVAPTALRLLAMAEWPGNVRQLKNVIEAAACGSTTENLEAADLAEFLSIDGSLLSPPDSLATHAEVVRPAEWSENEIEQALKRAGGNRSQAARLLGISRATLYRRLAAFRDGEPEVSHMSQPQVSQLSQVSQGLRHL